MNKLLKLIYSNKFFAVIALLLQIGMITAFILGVSNNTRFYILASNLISAILILVEVNRHEESAFKITWITLIAVIPIFGWFFYLYTHLDVMTKGIKTAHLNMAKRISTLKSDDVKTIREMEQSGCETSFVRYLSKTCENHVYPDTAFTYYTLGDEFFPQMYEELEKAEKFIFMEFFIINGKSEVWKKTEQILEKKAREGVEVRLMYDGMGCMGIMPKGYEKILESKGIKCRIFAPVQPLLSTYQNNRDHRKVVVIDGRCAFSGGVNLADEYANIIERFGHWKDTGFKLYGEGVRGFTEMFLTMWATTAERSEREIEKYIYASSKFAVTDAEGYVAPFCDSPLDDKPVGRYAYVDILNTAKKYVYIMTPYFVVDEAIFDAMNYAVTRGVDVKLILPGIPDKKMPYCLARSYYKDLLSIGVQVYEYIPGFVHAKTTVSDGKRAVVGTINYDYRSLYLHYECAVYLSDIPQIDQMEKDMINTLAMCRRITMTEYSSYPWYYRAMGRVLRFIATVI